MFKYKYFDLANLEYFVDLGEVKFLAVHFVDVEVGSVKKENTETNHFDDSVFLRWIHKLSAVVHLHASVDDVAKQRIYPTKSRQKHSKCVESAYHLLGYVSRTLELFSLRAFLCFCRERRCF